jgi:hypothetical protein
MVVSGMSLAAGFTIGAGLMFAGSALSFVGQITGNEKLTKVGGIMSLAGGVTSLVQNFDKVVAGVGGAAEGGAASTASEAVASSQGLSIAENVAGQAPLSDLGQSLYGSGGILEGANPALSASAGASSTVGSTMGSGTATGFDLGSGLGSGVSSLGSGTGSTFGASLGFDLGSSLGNNSGAATSDALSFSDWVKKNKEIIEVGSKVLSGVGDSLVKNEAAKYQSEAYLAAQQNNFDRADELMRRYSESVKKLQQRDVINPNANVGLINRAWSPYKQSTQGA